MDAMLGLIATVVCFVHIIYNAVAFDTINTANTRRHVAWPARLKFVATTPTDSFLASSALPADKVSDCRAIAP